MVIIVCGGRDFADRGALFAALDALHAKCVVTKVAQGQCPTGADAMAAEWAADREISCIGFKANWAEFGRKAGPMRNQQMADYGADGLVAFPGGKGTADMITRALKAGIKVWEPLRNANI